MTVATFDPLLFFPPWEGDGALIPCSTVALFDPLLLLLLPWAGGGGWKIAPPRDIDYVGSAPLLPPLFMPLLQLSPARVISFSKCIDIKCKNIIYSGWTIIVVVVVVTVIVIVIIVDVIIIVIVHNMTPFPSQDVISAIILVIHCVGQLLRLLLLTIWTSICVSLLCSQIVLCVSSKNSTIPVEEQRGVSR
jgi:hypothetical protein